MDNITSKIDSALSDNGATIYAIYKSQDPKGELIEMVNNFTPLEIRISAQTIALEAIVKMLRAVKNTRLPTTPFIRELYSKTNFVLVRYGHKLSRFRDMIENPQKALEALTADEAKQIELLVASETDPNAELKPGNDPDDDNIKDIKNIFEEDQEKKAGEYKLTLVDREKQKEDRIKNMFISYAEIDQYIRCLYKNISGKTNKGICITGRQDLYPMLLEKSPVFFSKKSNLPWFTPERFQEGTDKLPKGDYFPKTVESAYRIVKMADDSVTENEKIMPVIYDSLINAFLIAQFDKQITDETLNKLLVYLRKKVSVFVAGELKDLSNLHVKIKAELLEAVPEMKSMQDDMKKLLKEVLVTNFSNIIFHTDRLESRYTPILKKINMEKWFARFNIQGDPNNLKQVFLDQLKKAISS